MSFVNPLSALGEPEREGPQTLRALAARRVAEQLQTQIGRERFEAAGTAVDSAFQLARADAIAQEAAGLRRNQADRDYVGAYESVMFSAPRRIGPKNADGLTASMRARRRLMQNDLREPFYAKLRRLAARDQRLSDPVVQALTPEEVVHLSNPLPVGFLGFLCQYYHLPALGEVLSRGGAVISPGRAAGFIMEEKGLEWATADRLVRIAYGRWMQQTR